ncbi:Elongation factor G, mitochondrial, partial [Ananas comosus]
LKYSQTQFNSAQKGLNVQPEVIFAPTVNQYIEPLPMDLQRSQAIPSNFIPAIEKGFKEASNRKLQLHPLSLISVIISVD